MPSSSDGDRPRPDRLRDVFGACETESFELLTADALAGRLRGLDRLLGWRRRNLDVAEGRVSRRRRIIASAVVLLLLLLWYLVSFAGILQGPVAS